jgi:glycosyltransferase involved in cell wall biosynthesis
VRPDLDLVAFVNREAAEAGGGPWGELIPSVTVPVRARRRAEWVRGEQQHVPRLARRERADVVHSLASTGPVHGRTARVVTIHDLIYHRYPEAHFGLRSMGMRVLVPLAARRSDRVIAVSQATRDDLVSILGLPADKIDVVHQGLGAEPAAAPAREADLRGRLELGTRPVLLAVSAKRPHKNIERLLDALALSPPGERPVLVIPGYPTPHEDRLRQRAGTLGVAGDVRFLGWVSAEDLEGLYGLASGFVFPSLWEGFGLPVLEAMRRGVPVACSDRASLPEITGGAALLFDPEDTRQVAGAMARLLANGPDVARLRREGPARAARFTWDATARGTIASYARALSPRGGG